MGDEVDLDVELSRTPAAPLIARRAISDLCAGRLDGDLLADARLMVSEMASNALRHGRGTISLRGALDANRLLVEVVDQGDGFEHALRDVDVQRRGGWGLQILDERSSRWGVHEGSSHVWFELELPAPRRDQAAGPAPIA